MKSILVCMHHRANPNQPSCGARGAAELKQALEQAVALNGMAIGVKEIQCLGECETGPNARLIPGGPILRHLDAEQLDEVISTAKAFLKA